MSWTMDWRAEQKILEEGKQMNELSIEAKLAIIIRLAELIDQVKDAETLGGLRTIFGVLVKNIAYDQVH